MARRALAIERYTGGITPAEIVAGGAGLAGASMLPGVFIKTVAVTGTEKAIKIGASALAALAVGYVFRMQSARAGRAAILGGLSGVGVQLVNTLRPGTIEAGRPSGRLLGPGKRVGEAATISPAMQRTDENVTLIRP